MICRIFFALLLMVCAGHTLAQRVAFPGGKYYIYRVQLADKQGSRHSLKHPERFLSEKALERRSRQHLSVDSTDLPLSQKYLEELSKGGFVTVGGSKWNNTVLVKSIDTTVVNGLKVFSFVRNVTKVFEAPDSINAVEVFDIKKDTTKADMKNIYGKALEQIEQLNGLPLHEAGFRGKGKTVAVIDGGFMNADKISALKGVRVKGVRDFVPPYKDNLYRQLDHGTLVLSCMAAVDSFRFIGTAPEADYWLLRSEYGPTESLLEEDTWAMAAEFADSVGVDVINSSLGYAQFDDKTQNHKYVDLDGERTLIAHTASMLADKGMVLVCSAGNEGIGTWKKLTPPGDARDAITVGAVDKQGVNTIFSSIGPSQDGRVKPDVMARGAWARVINGHGVNATANGTSLSAPITCGMVVCLWQSLPTKTAKEIIDLVRRSSNRFATPDNIFGYGIPDFWKAHKMGL